MFGQMNVTYAFFENCILAGLAPGSSQLSAMSHITVAEKDQMAKLTIISASFTKMDTNFADKRRSLGLYSSLSDQATEFF
jgi:hypothetical protein